MRRMWRMKRRLRDDHGHRDGYLEGPVAVTLEVDGA